MINDNGKVRISIREGIPVVDIYLNGELQIEDVVWSSHTLLNAFEPPLQPPADLIINRTGSYSLSQDAYLIMKDLAQNSNRIAYVIHNPMQEVVVDLAANSYFAGHPVGKFSTIEDATKWLKKKSHPNELHHTLTT